MGAYGNDLRHDYEAKWRKWAMNRTSASLVGSRQFVTVGVRNVDYRLRLCVETEVRAVAFTRVGNSMDILRSPDTQRGRIVPAAASAHRKR